MKYCIYLPYSLNTVLFDSAKTNEEVVKSFQNFIINDEYLDNKLETIKKFIRNYQYKELTLLKYNNKIQAVIISRDGYRPFEILPVISDINNLQCFIAVSLQWNNLVEINKNIANENINNQAAVTIVEDCDYILQLYNENKERLVPLITRAFDKLTAFYRQNNIH